MSKSKSRLAGADGSRCKSMFRLGLLQVVSVGYGCITRLPLKGSTKTSTLNTCFKLNWPGIVALLMSLYPTFYSRSSFMPVHQCVRGFLRSPTACKPSYRAAFQHWTTDDVPICPLQQTFNVHNLPYPRAIPFFMLRLFASNPAK